MRCPCPDSIGITNHAASISSAQLVTSSGGISTTRGTTSAQRRATASTITEEEAPAAPVPTPAGSAIIDPDVEPEAPPVDQVLEVAPPYAAQHSTLPEVPSQELAEEPAEERLNEVSEEVQEAQVQEETEQTPSTPRSPIPTMIFTQHEDDEPEERHVEEPAAETGDEAGAELENAGEDEEVVDLSGAAAPYEGVDEGAFDASESMEDVGL